MKQAQIFQESQARTDIKLMLGSHNFSLLLKHTGLTQYKFPQIRTIHGDYITPDTYHQFLRYCIAFKGDELQKIRQYSDSLEKIAHWLNERL
jgi:hypothetical protein